MGLEELAVSMNRLGIHYTVLESGADGAVLILPEYGRVLGVWPHWRGENALWVNPDFLRMLEIGAKDDGWLNPGGDRIWLGPREEFFPHDTVPPPSLDPGRYEGAAEKGVFSMENKGEVHAWKSGTMLGFRIQRRLRSLEEQEISDAWGTRWLRQAGYVEETTLEVSRQIPASVWLWNLTQVPGSAETLEARGASDRSAGAEPLTRKIICVDEHDDGRSQLLVKAFEVPGEGQDGPGAGEPQHRKPSAPESPGTGVISCVSCSADARERRRVVLRTSLCAFSGRTAEIRAAAAMIAGYTRR
ncbi:MAG: hypothetical protein ACLQCB_19000 [Spirochaetia bacterium]